MKASQNLSILFWINTPKSDNGKAPIYVRITIDSKRAQFSLGRKIQIEKWNRQSGTMKANSEEARTLNAYINHVRGELQRQYNLLCSSESQVTAIMLRNTFLGKTEKKKTLMDTFEYHNHKMKELATIEKYSSKTLQRYKITMNKVQQFMLHQYKASDRPLDELKYAFITEFEHYLLTKQHLGNNTVMKYIKNLKKILTLAVSLDWLPNNPFQNFKCTYQNPEREILSQEELDRIYTKQFSIKRLEEVRDVFVFCCYTGFAYSEVAAFSRNAVTIGLDGGKWLSINRKKTSAKESVPLLPIPLEIIEKYKDHLYCKAHDKLLPVNSNQKYNGLSERNRRPL